MDYSKLYSAQALKMKSSKIRELMKYASMPGVISFGGGAPDPNNFPIEDVRSIINNWDNKKFIQAMQYGSTEGFPLLIEKIKERMKYKKNINIENQNLILTTGGQQAIFLLSKILINQDDIVIVEEPSFIGAMASFLSNGANIIGIKLDDDGVNINKLEETIINLKNNNKNPKFFYTIPNFQNPSGITMSQNKRKKIYDISKKYDLIVIEDDPYGDLFFSGNEQDYLPIKSYGNDAPIFYIGSFSKILCPGFRLGWLIGDPEVVEKCSLAKQSIDACSSSFGQMIAIDYLISGAIDNYLNKMKQIYKEKKDYMYKSIINYFPPNIKTSNPDGGFFLYIDLPPNISAQQLFNRTIEKKVAFVTGDPFHPDPVEGDKHIRLSFSNSTIEEIDKGIKIIGNELRNF